MQQESRNMVSARNFFLFEDSCLLGCCAAKVRVTFPFHTNKAYRGEQGCSSTHSQLEHDMELTGQFHVLAILSREWMLCCVIGYIVSEVLNDHSAL
jgi:hypothetical protein